MIPGSDRPDSRETHLFTDPISLEVVELTISGSPSFWDGTVGVRHGTCSQLADVSPDLDAFYCRECRWNGRISGAWAVDMVQQYRETHR